MSRKTKQRRLTASQARRVSGVKAIAITGDREDLIITTEKAEFVVDLDDMISDWSRKLKWPLAPRQP